MIEISALLYIELGMQIEQARTTFDLAEYKDENYGPTPLTDAERSDLRAALEKLLAECKKVNLPTSVQLLSRATNDLPQTIREFNIIVDAVQFEIKGKLFLYIAEHRAKFYNLILPSIITNQFPSASSELVSAGNSFAAGLNTATVFHSMRAAEIGVRAFADLLNVKFSFPLEFAE